MAVTGRDTPKGHSYHLKPSRSKLRQVRAALEEAEETANEWSRRGRCRMPGEAPINEAARAADLAEVIEQLEQARRPLTTYVKRLPYVGRTGDAAYRLNRDVDRMLRRLRSMRAPTSGTCRPARTEDARSTRGMLNRAKQVLEAIEADHEAMCRGLAAGSPRTMRSGAVIRTTAELQAEARAFIDHLDATRRLVTTHWQRYQAGYLARRDAADNPYRIADEYDDLAAYVTAIRDEARALRRRLMQTATRKVPEQAAHTGRKPYEQWTEYDFIEGWIAFRERHGRLPRKADHHPRNGLPHYTQLRRSLGPYPSKQMLRLVADATTLQEPI